MQDGAPSRVRVATDQVNARRDLRWPMIVEQTVNPEEAYQSNDHCKTGKYAPR
jgi:hypothetical protein